MNIAARLEGLAEPGGICISRPVHTQIKGKLDLTFEHLGEKEVKNITEPVSVYRVVLDEKAAALVTPLSFARVTANRGRWPQIRITSYNVCYTKLLRIANPGKPGAIKVSADFAHFDARMAVVHVVDIECDQTKQLLPLLCR